MWTSCGPPGFPYYKRCIGRLIFSWFGSQIDFLIFYHIKLLFFLSCRFNIMTWTVPKCDSTLFLPGLTTADDFKHLGDGVVPAKFSALLYRIPWAGQRWLSTTVCLPVQFKVVFGMRLIRRPWQGCQFWDVPFTIPWKGCKFQKWGLRNWGYRICFFSS